MKQNSFYEAVSHSGGQEIPHMISEYSLLYSQQFTFWATWMQSTSHTLFL